MQKQFVIISLCSATLLTACLTAQESQPVALVFNAYIYEARSNGEETIFPLFPGETSVANIDEEIKTSQEYLEKLQSIYSFPHFYFLGKLAGCQYFDWDGSPEAAQYNRTGFDRIYYSLRVDRAQKMQGMSLPLRLTFNIDTLRSSDEHSLPIPEQALFKTLVTVRNGHPIVFGRPISDFDGHKRAIFLTLAVHYVELNDREDYDNLIALYHKFIKPSQSSGDRGGKKMFERVNQYYSRDLGKKWVQDANDIVWESEPPPPPPPPVEGDLFAFVPHDGAPTPIGGFEALQKAVYYPENARRAGREGFVRVMVQIHKSGEVSNTRIVRSLGKDMDDAAIYAVKKVKWRPAKKDGDPVTVWVMVPIEFRLK